MYYPRKQLFISMILAVFAFFLSQCAGTAAKDTEISDEQKEKDLITLLNARQVKPPDMLTDIEKENIDQKMSELEKKNKENKDEIDVLRSEILLKDEKIRQLEEQLRSPSKEEGIQEKQKPVQPIQTAGLSEFAAAYHAALNEFMSRKYQNSLVMFQRLLGQNRQHLLSDNCQYWIGECHFALKDYNNAIIAFEKVFTYLKSNKDDDAQLKLGICYYRLGDMKRTKDELTKLVNNYPKSEYVSRAKNMLATIR